MKTYVLGLDPSLTGTGYAVIEVNVHKKSVTTKVVDIGEIVTSNKVPMPIRLNHIYHTVGMLVNKYHPLYPTIFGEKGFTKHSTATQSIFRAKGAIETALVGFNYVEYSPTTVKKVITTNGSASKEEVASSLLLHFNLNHDIFKSDNESDALAVALCGLKDAYEEVVEFAKSR